MNLFNIQDFFKLCGVILFFYLLKSLYDIIYCAYFGPLSIVPGPKLFPLTRLFISFKQISGQRWKWIQNVAVPTYGPMVRLGPNLVLISDKDAIKERRILSPAFSIKYVSSLEPLMILCVKDLIYKVDECIEKKTFSDGAALNIVNLVQSCVLDIIGETNFGGKFNSIETLSHPLPGKVYQELRRRAMKSLFPLFKSFMKYDQYLLDLSNELIKNRRQAEKSRVDILQAILDVVKTEESDQITDFEIFDQILEFLIAGTDTVGLTASMAITLLAKNPDKLKLLQQELDNALGNCNDELPKHDQLKALPYLNAVINETMRLWPVTLDGGIGRSPEKDTIINGYMIPARTNLVLNYYHLHHDPKYWGKNVEEFVPERWLDLNNSPKDIFYPFSAGSRNCIGQNFALMEMRLIIASLLFQFDVKDILAQELDIVCYITPSFNNLKYDLVFSKRSFKSINNC
ncbi:cytochrome P450 [Rhizophagus irregularis]|uniref:Cytochrome P450 n=1 Tax=Rhizophagus irregularis TaxID=588596 RepID=A0A2N0Q7P3_9GLOM|nr:cytochrome P450 [Rhizophagus irregularis]